MTIKDVSKKFGMSEDALRYYERVGMIPPVHRTSGGIRNYTEEDIGWVELAVCMRSAGLPVEVMTRYLSLFREGSATIPDRLKLLTDQKTVLLAQEEAIKAMLSRLDYKIARYQEALQTGKLVWGNSCEPEGSNGKKEGK